jgi:hypothetical protein
MLQKWFNKGVENDCIFVLFTVASGLLVQVGRRMSKWSGSRGHATLRQHLMHTSSNLDFCADCCSAIDAYGPRARPSNPDVYMCDGE